MYMNLIYTLRFNWDLNLFEVCATQSRCTVYIYILKSYIMASMENYILHTLRFDSWLCCQRYMFISYFLQLHVPYFTDDRSMVFFLNTLASTYTRMKLKKSGIPKKNLDKNDDFVYSIPLFCSRFFFLNKIEIVDVLGVVFVLNKEIKVYY